MKKKKNQVEYVWNKIITRSNLQYIETRDTEALIEYIDTISIIITRLCLLSALIRHHAGIIYQYYVFMKSKWKPFQTDRILSINLWNFFRNIL